MMAYRGGREREREGGSNEIGQEWQEKEGLSLPFTFQPPPTMPNAVTWASAMSMGKRASGFFLYWKMFYFSSFFFLVASFSLKFSWCSSVLCFIFLFFLFLVFFCCMVRCLVLGHCALLLFRRLWLHICFAQLVSHAPPYAARPSTAAPAHKERSLRKSLPSCVGFRFYMESGYISSWQLSLKRELGVCYKFN